MSTSSTTRALVLGGGGPVGRAWETGIATRLIEAQVRLADADLIVGTSAGAIVGAEIGLGPALKAWQPTPPGPAYSATPPAAPSPGMQKLLQALGAVAISTTPEVELMKIGQIALAAPTPSEELTLGRSNLAAVTGQPWPTGLRTTAVSTRTGHRHVFDASSGVPLEYALAASSALPGAWPPISIGDERYMDGGTWSNLNADLATGYNRVIIISCFALDPDASLPNQAATRKLLQEIDALRTSGSDVHLITPDTAFQTLTHNGTQMLNPALEAAAYTAGRNEADAELASIHNVWDIADGGN